MLYLWERGRWVTVGLRDELLKVTAVMPKSQPGSVRGTDISICIPG